MTAEAYLRESIMDPSAFLAEGYEDNMDKGYKFVIKDEEVDDLIAFMLTQ